MSPPYPHLQPHPTAEEVGREAHEELKSSILEAED
jgi:hypothetical protein